MVRSTLARAMKTLPKELFVKIHRSHVVSVVQIDIIYNDHVLLLGQPVPVSRQYYLRLMKRASVIGLEELAEKCGTNKAYISRI